MVFCFDSGRNWRTDVLPPALTVQDRVYPWFSNRFGYILCGLDCVGGKLLGHADELADILNLLNPDVIETLIMSSCSELEMPTIITQCSSLERLEILESTIHQWPLEAAISETSTPQLQTLKITWSSFTSVPGGIFQRPLPSLRSITFEQVSTSMFKDQVLNTTWPNLVELNCWNCNFTSIPPAIASMKQLETLTLEYNFITSVSREEIGGLNHTSIKYLNLDENPIFWLPDDVWLAFCAPMTRLFMRYTYLGDLPVNLIDPIKAQCADDVQAIEASGNYDAMPHLNPFGTPICDSLAMYYGMNDTIHQLIRCQPY